MIFATEAHEKTRKKTKASLATKSTKIKQRVGRKLFLSPARTSPTCPIPLVQAVKTGAIPEASRPLFSAADGRRRDGGSFHGNSCTVGSPFLWVLSFGEAKESTPPPRGKRQIKNIRAADTPDRTRLAAKPVTACGQPCPSIRAQRQPIRVIWHIKQSKCTVHILWR